MSRAKLRESEELKLEEKISVSVKLQDYNAGVIRYAAYAVSGSAYAFLEPGRKGEIIVTLEPRGDQSAKARAALEKRFRSELKDEKLRSGLADSNRELRDFIILKALTPPSAPPPGDDSGLTPAQEKELDELIAQVEREIKTETPIKDPLGLSKTWEEKNDPKFSGKKAKNKK